MKESRQDKSLTSFFLKIQEQEKQKQIVKLHVGDPQLPTPENIQRAGIQAIKGEKTHYTSPFGSPELRQLIASKYSGVDPDNVLVSSGGRLILAGVFRTFLQQGDRVMIPAPYYPSFREIVSYFRGVPVYIDTSVNDFFLTEESLKRALDLNGIPEFLIINSPNNPTGVIYSVSELRKVVELSRHYGFSIVFDECYSAFSYLSFDFREICPEAIIVNSCSKTYAMSGWRIGWAIAPSKDIARMKEFFQTVVGSLCSISQEAALEALRTDKRIEDFSRQREMVYDFLDELGIVYPRTEGAFYVFPDLSSFFSSSIRDSFDLAEYLLDRAGVAVAPGEVFGDYPGHVRLAYCLEESVLRKGLQEIKKSLL